MRQLFKNFMQFKTNAGVVLPVTWIPAIWMRSFAVGYQVNSVRATQFRQ